MRGFRCDEYFSVRTPLKLAPVVLGMIVVSACGHSASTAGAAPAAQACKAGGSQAAQLADQAAAVNAKYATLATDENALAASESTQQSELADGSDDGSLVGATSLGSPGSIKVIADCTGLGLPVTPTIH
jgi:hypothetical protein